MAKAAKEKAGESRTKLERVEVSQDSPGGDSQEISQEKAQGEVDREWRCLTCLATAPPAAAGYMALIKHQCTGEKKVRLVALETGEDLASNFKEAQTAGLLGKLKVEATPRDKKGLSAGGVQLTPDLNIRITITLPAIDIARFKIAKIPRPGGLPALEPDHDKSFDEFVHDCINERFAKVWKMVLVLAPMKALKEEKDDASVKSS